MKLEWIKRLASNKKVCYGVATIVVVGVLTGIFMGSVMRHSLPITDVFFQNESSEIRSTLEVAGEYGTTSLTQKEKEILIDEVAKAIGLNTENALTMSQKGNISEVAVQRNAKAADTTIKLVSVDTMKDGKAVGTNHYLFVKMELYDKVQSILNYQKLLETAYKALGISNPQSNVALMGVYKGQLSLNQKNEVTDHMIDQLGGNVTYENRKDDMYTVYAYSGNLSDYIQVADSKVNIQVAMNYDELADETVVYLASPILNTSY